MLARSAGATMLTSLILTALLPTSAQAQSPLWDTTNGGGGFDPPDRQVWADSYGPFTNVDDITQAAYQWCMTTPDYVNPATDCQHHPAFTDYVDWYDGGGPQFEYFIAIINIRRNNGFHGTVQAVWYPLYTSDADCPTNQVISHTGHSCVDERYYAEAPTQNCPTVSNNPSNPCDPANGNKSQIELDYAGGGEGALTFARFYNSRGAYRTGPGMAVGWRHTYLRRIDEPPDAIPAVAFAAPAGQSSSYLSASDACASGWDEIRNDAWGGDLSAATATFLGGNVCKIESGGAIAAYFPVRSGHGWYGGITPPSTIKTVTRPNGSRIVFEHDGSAWASELDPSVSLVESGSDWIFTDSDDTRELYDSTGRLISITRRNGQTSTLDYDRSVTEGGDGNDTTLDRVTGPFGHEIRIRHTNGLVWRVTTPDGIIEYSYDAANNLESVQYPDATVRQYHYEDATLPNHLTGITDENGDRYVTWSYDTAGRAILSERAGGKESVQFVYNPDGSTTLQMGNGATRNYIYSTEQGNRRLATLTGDVCGTCPGGDIAGRTYDSNGFVDEVTDWNGNVTQTVRNGRGLTETLIEAKGSTEQRTTTTIWHPTYRLPTQITAPKNVTDFTHDAGGNIETATVSSGPLTRAWIFTYNANGQPLTVDGPRTDVSDVTTLDYYNCNTGDECGQLQSVTNARGQTTSYDAYDAAGRLLRLTDPNGLQTSFTYDNRGNVLTVTQTPTAGTPRVTTMTYDDTRQLKTFGAPDGLVLSYSYGPEHYLSSVADNLGNRIDYDYDTMGNLIDEDVFDPGNTLKRAMDYAYDLNNRLDTVTNGGFVTDLTIDAVGNLTGETDPVFAGTQHDYDALNRLDETLDALTGVMDYGYDDHDNITSISAANGATTTFEYDDLDNLTKEIGPDRGTIVYTHDEAGNVETTTDARGKVTAYAYDALDRLTLETLDGGATIAYEYDQGTNAIGRLSRITDSSGETSWSYDNFGAVTSKTQTIGSVALTTGYVYDANGRLTSMTLPSGKVVSYGYNSYQADSVTVDGTTILTGAGYDPFGPVNGWTWGNGSTHSRTYDLRGLVTSHSIGPDTRTLGYDDAGRLETLSDSRHADSFDYDLLGRLDDYTHVGGAPLPATQVFSYDANGNRSSITENGMLYGYGNQADSNRLLSTAGPEAKTFGYDASGNVIQAGHRSYGYDDRGRLVDVESGSWIYAYNGQGQRVRKGERRIIHVFSAFDVEGQGIDAGLRPVRPQQRPMTYRTIYLDTLFAYDEGGRLIGEYNAQGRPIQETVWFNGAPVSVLKGDDKHYVHTDPLGTPRAISSGDTILWRWESDPFGKTPPQEDPDGDAAKFTYNLRFPGQYYDKETELHYNYFRHYDASTGRYLQSDPIGLGGGPNTYGYVYQNPLSYTDPTGEFGITKYIYKLFQPLTKQTDQEAEVAGMIVDAIVGGAVTVLEPDFCEEDYKYGREIGTALDVVQVGGGIQTVLLSTALTKGLYGFTATLSSATAAAIVPGVVAAIGGYEIGTGLNSLYERYSGTSIGSQIYDLFHDDPI